jgi:hypothetical protein
VAIHCERQSIGHHLDQIALATGLMMARCPPDVEDAEAASTNDERHNGQRADAAVSERRAERRRTPDIADEHGVAADIRDLHISRVCRWRAPLPGTGRLPHVSATPRLAGAHQQRGRVRGDGRSDFVERSRRLLGAERGIRDTLQVMQVDQQTRQRARDPRDPDRRDAEERQRQHLLRRHDRLKDGFDEEERGAGCANGYRGETGSAAAAPGGGEDAQQRDHVRRLPFQDGVEHVTREQRAEGNTDSCGVAHDRSRHHDALI